MNEYVGRVADRVGYEPPVVPRCIGIIVDFLGTQEPVRTVPALLGGLPGSGLLLAEMDVAGDGEVLALELSGRADVS